MSAEPAAQEWRVRPERSVTPWIRFIVWAGLRLGRPMARLMLLPTCLYFVLFSIKPRAASRAYLARVLGRPPRWRELYRHYFVFAACLLDRVFLLRDRREFEIAVQGEAAALAIAARGEGCILLGAHLGSFEVVRAAARHHPGLNVSLVMYEENAQKINAVLNALAPSLGVEVIGLGRWDAMLKVAERLQQGAFIGVLADRSLAGTDARRCPFLGAPAAFPLGPFRMAVALGRPVMLMVGLYRGGRRYEIHLEPIAEAARTPRPARPAAAEALLRRYVARLEHYCRLAPYNWFNFYDFWA